MEIIRRSRKFSYFSYHIVKHYNIYVKGCVIMNLSKSQITICSSKNEMSNQSKDCIFD